MEVKQAVEIVTSRYLNVYKAIGDGLWGLSTTVTGFAVYNEVHWIAYSAIITGLIGKFIINVVESLKNN